MKKFLTIIFLAIVFFSCEEATEWELQESDYSPLVVDGILTDEVKFQTINLSKIKTSLNDINEAISDAVVIIRGEGNSYNLYEDENNPGVYISEEEFGGTIGKTYSLFISYENENYSAQAKMKIGEDFQPFLYSKINNKYQIKFVAPVYHGQKAAMYEINLDWSHLPIYSDSSYEYTHARLYAYTLTSLDVTEIFAPNYERVRFPLGTKVVQNRYSLTVKHEEYLRALLLETTWNGGYFGTTHANLPTNLSDGAVGFWANSAINTKEFIITEEGSNK